MQVFAKRISQLGLQFIEDESIGCRGKKKKRKKKEKSD